MFRQDLYKLKKSGRVCYPFPWDSHKLPCPWKGGYMRVMIPLTVAERKGSTKPCHTQIVKISNLEKVQEGRLTLQ